MLALLVMAADAVVVALVGQGEWGLFEGGDHAAQYHHDRTADRAVLDVLESADVAVLSEESGLRGGHTVDAGRVVVVVDPIDGSTNASRRLPWWSTALCAVDDQGPWVAVVHDHDTGVRFHAVRGAGAFRTEPGGAPEPVVRPATPELAGAVISLSGWPPRHYGWAQFRAYGSLALELCAVADGRLDGHVQFVTDEVGAWDYLAGALVCAEAGALVADAFGRDLVDFDHSSRRTPIAAGDGQLLSELLAARRDADESNIDD
jgi:fructose-1,6-bisphosphatase/inositol monophosphatase family enzyme